MSSKPTSAFHYTCGHKLPGILEAGELRPSKPMTPREIGVLWFTVSPVWDETATKLLMDAERRRPVRPTQAQLHKYLGLFRFILPTKDQRLIRWPELWKRARISPKEVPQLVSRGVACGAKPMDWCGTLVAVPIADLQFEAWDGHSAWLPAELVNSAARFLEHGPKVGHMHVTALSETITRQAWDVPLAPDFPADRESF